jgi:hypothetical protein
MRASECATRRGSAARSTEHSDAWAPAGGGGQVTGHQPGEREFLFGVRAQGRVILLRGLAECPLGSGQPLWW